MKIWVDADACPVVVKEILSKAAHRTQTHCYFVANRYTQLPGSDFLHSVVVEKGFDIADHRIVNDCQAGDLIITSDIPLASEVIDKKAQALNPRGELYTPENIRQRLNIRDFMDTMRASGEQTGKTAAYSQKDKQAFANQLDRILAQNKAR
ncbi:YaiI/YqxD family protein [Planctobacterium marinum]|uniref:YaiI/YqxD family protein n=1 Tax=Planctobacterium marinum TaxID=1631968 RepID=UPI001E3565CE|nr:YaiI/YqxD family protein [Planctobacterium marinum]MCC2607099.1 YaiI/YqxD family protein [Planctobacterium marinum]